MRVSLDGDYQILVGNPDIDRPMEGSTMRDGILGISADPFPLPSAQVGQRYSLIDAIAAMVRN